MRLAITLSLIALAAFVLALETRAATYPPLDKVASTFAGRPIEATCPTPAEWEAHPAVRGYNVPGSPAPLALTHYQGGVPVYMWLSPPACGLLVAYSALLATPSKPCGYARGGAPARYYLEYARRCAKPELPADPTGETQLRTAAALLALVHEAFHMSGIRDEGEAECRAIRSVEQAARLLGARRPSAIVELARRVHASAPPTYRSVC